MNSPHDRNGKGPESTSRSLLIGLRNQDPDAWDRLVFLYAPSVVGWCRQLKLREQEIPDVLQEVFQVVATKLGQFSKQKSSGAFRGWLRTVTRTTRSFFCVASKTKPQLRADWKQTLAFPPFHQSNRSMQQIQAAANASNDESRRWFWLTSVNPSSERLR